MGRTMSKTKAKQPECGQSRVSGVIHERFSVPFDYPVHFTQAVFDPANPLLASAIGRRRESRRHRVLVYVDSGVAEATPGLVRRIKAYFARRADTLELVDVPKIVPGGECAKNGWNEVRAIMTAIGDRRMCRQSFVVAIGGGSVLDMVGFATALVHRGLRLIRLPTTVLAQNDAGVGVKNGMNEQETKNFVGAFAPPFAVINDCDFLLTLRDRDWVGGIAEAYKVAIIKNAAFFRFLCRSAARLKARDFGLMQTLVRRCAALHLTHIRTSGDPFEFGSARPLDFGHWSAHKLEAMSGFEIGHGQAVALGIALDSYYAMRQGLLSRAELERILAGMAGSGLPVWSPLLDRKDRGGRPEVFQGLDQFREHLGGELTLVMPRGIGAQCEVHRVDTAILQEAMAYLSQWSAHRQAPG